MFHSNLGAQSQTCGRSNPAHFALENLECRRLLSAQIIDLAKPIEMDVGQGATFQFAAIAGRSYSFSAAASTDPGPSLALSNDAGATLWSTAARYIVQREWTAPQSGTYELLVDGSQSIHLIAWAHLDDAGNDAAHAKPLSTAKSLDGHLDGDGDVDFFKFEATAGATISAVLDDHGTSSDLDLLDSNMQELIAPEGGYTEPSFLEKMAIVPSTGTYYVRVRPATWDADQIPGIYTLRLKQLPPDDFGDTPALAHPLQLGRSIQGTGNYHNEQDWFSFQAIKGKTYRLHNLSGAGAAGMGLVDRDGKTVLAGNDAEYVHLYGPYQQSIDWVAPASGTYFLMTKPVGLDAADPAVSSSYTITAVQVLDADTHPPCDPTMLSSNVNDLLDHPGQVNWYRFQPLVGHEYEITTEHKGIKNLLRLRFLDAEGKLIDSNFGYDWANLSATGNIAYLAISAMTPTDAGAYSIRVQDRSVATALAKKHHKKRQRAKAHHHRRADELKVDKPRHLSRQP